MLVLTLCFLKPLVLVELCCDAALPRGATPGSLGPPLGSQELTQDATASEEGARQVFHVYVSLDNETCKMNKGHTEFLLSKEFSHCPFIYMGSNNVAPNSGSGATEGSGDTEGGQIQFKNQFLISYFTQTLQFSIIIKFK